VHKTCIYVTRASVTTNQRPFVDVDS